MAVMVPAGRWLPDPTYLIVFAVNVTCVVVPPAKVLPVW